MNLSNIQILPVFGLMLFGIFWMGGQSVAQAPQWTQPLPESLSEFLKAKETVSKEYAMSIANMPVNEVPDQGLSRLMVGGQPMQEHFGQLKMEGFEVIINMRPDAELQGFPEKEVVESLGMIYEHLPIVGPGDITFEHAQRLDELLQDYQDRNVLVHCASGNRVGALFALKAYYIDGQDVQTSMQVGEQHGLTKLRPYVQSLLLPKNIQQ